MTVSRGRLLGYVIELPNHGGPGVPYYLAGHTPPGGVDWVLINCLDMAYRFPDKGTAWAVYNREREGLGLRYPTESRLREVYEEVVTRVAAGGIVS